MKIIQALLNEPWLIEPSRLPGLVAMAERTAASIDREAVDRAREKLEALGVRPGTLLPGARSATVRENGVAVLPIHGPIIRHGDLFTEICEVATTESITRDLEKALASDQVSGIVLHVDSPGGQAADIGELAGMIRAGNDRKPIVAYTGNQAASAGYWLAAGASEIVASRTALLGSIGAVIRLVDEDPEPGTREYKYISSQSPLKQAQPGTKAGDGQYQEMVDALASEFLRAVAEFRGTTPEVVARDFGKGGQLIGEAAVKVGMADRIGTFEDVVRSLGHGQRKITQVRMPAASAGERDDMDKDTKGTEPQVDANAEALKTLQAQVKAQAEALEAAAREADGLKADAVLSTLKGRLTPAQIQEFKPGLVAFAEDDRKSPREGFSRLAFAKGLLETVAEHGLTGEHLAGGEDPDLRTFDLGAGRTEAEAAEERARREANANFFKGRNRRSG